MSIYVDELKIPKCNTVMKFAYPKTENEFATINLNCGENYTGKSFILSKIRSLYEEQRVEQFGFTIKYVQTDSDNMTNVLYFGKVWKHNDKCGGYTFDSKKTLNSSDGPKIYENILHFCYDLLFSKNKLGITDNDFFNFQNVDLRLKLIDQLNIDVEGEKCYPCNKEHPLVQKLEKLFKNKRLYYRFTKLKGHSAPRFELVLVNANGFSVPYDSWSDGQKCVFFSLLTLEYEKSDLLLIDEIENHLHPTYISQLFEIIKQLKTQCIVVTHHPHVIFSNYVDRVFYITNTDDKFNNSERQIVQYKHSHMNQQPFSREIYTLENDFERISNVYQLFDRRDNQLLHISQYFLKEIEVSIYAQLNALGSSNKPVHSKNSVLPDSQTQMLYKNLKAYFRDNHLNILDVGAGFGRVKMELDKYNEISSKNNWYLFNVEPEQVELTKLKFEKNSNVYSIFDYTQIEDDSIDLVLLANVIHEITPISFSEILYNISKKMKTTGMLVILEMEPLLHPEKFAVPYNYGELVTFFNTIKWRCQNYSMNHRNVNLYCLTITKREQSIADKQIILDYLNNLWERKLSDSLSSYDMSPDTLTYENYVKMIQDMTTIASINAYKKEIWL